MIFFIALGVGKGKVVNICRERERERRGKRVNFTSFKVNEVQIAV